LIGTLEPGDDFFDSINVDEIGAMSSPERIGIEAA
jgi:hypothetical protein